MIFLLDDEMFFVSRIYVEIEVVMKFVYLDEVGYLFFENFENDNYDGFNNNNISNKFNIY